MQTQQDRARAEWLAQRRGAELKELDFWIAKLPESRELRWVRVSRKCWGYTAIHLECVGPCVIQPKVWRPAQADAVARRLPVLAQDQGRAGPGWVTHEWCPLSSVFTHLWRILLHRSAYPEVGQTKIGHPSIHPRHIRETPTSVSLITLVLSKKENTSFRFARKSRGIFVGISCPHGAPIKGPPCQEFVLDRDWPKDRLLNVEEFLQHQEKWWSCVPRLKQKEWLVAKPPRVSSHYIYNYLQLWWYIIITPA